MDPEATLLLPGPWSTFAPRVDGLFELLCAVSWAALVAVVAAALWCVWRYRRAGPSRAEPPRRNRRLEVACVAGPLPLLALLFHEGAKGYVDMTLAPQDALVIRARARKWSWEFEYPSGAREVNELHVPVGRPVRLVLTSDDVIHGLYVPAFRAQRDAVPGRYSTLWFQATREGRTPFFCSEYCGSADTGSRDELDRETWAGHFSMIGTVIVEHAAAFEEHTRLDDRPCRCWRQCVPDGERLYRSAQCYVCHSVDGTPRTGPTWLHLYGSKVFLTDGTSVIVDDDYIRESILNPQAHVVRGYQPVMPTYAGTLYAQQIEALIEYIRRLR